MKNKLLQFVLFISIISISSVIQAQIIPVTGIETEASSLTLSLKTGDVFDITATVFPSNATNKVLEYTTSNNAVAGVNKSGQIVAYSQGTAVIRITSVSNPEVFTDVVVNIIILPDPVTVIQCEKSNVTLKVGESTNVDIEILPLNATNSEIAITCQNPEIAQVAATFRAVNIKGIAMGKTNILVISVSDPHVSCKIDVTVLDNKPSKCINSTVPSTFKDTVYFSKTEHTIQGEKCIATTDFLREMNTEYKWITEYKSSVNFMAENMFVGIGLQYQHEIVSIWKYDSTNYCNSDSARIVFIEKSCLPAISPIGETFIEIAPDQALPILGIKENDITWFDKNLHPISQDSYLDLKELKIDRTVSNHIFYAMRQQADCKSSIIPFEIQQNAYTISGKISSDFPLLYTQLVIDVNDGSNSISLDKQGNFTFHPTTQGEYKLTLHSQKGMKVLQDSIQIVTLSPNEFQKQVNFTCKNVEYSDIKIFASSSPFVVGREFYGDIKIINTSKKQSNIPITISVGSEIIDFGCSKTLVSKNDTTFEFTIDQLEYNKPYVLKIYGRILPDWQLSGKPVSIQAYIQHQNFDINPINDTVIFTQNILNSCDPNDKAATPSVGEQGYILMEKPLQYHIRFQNTGTFDAENIVVVDTLDSNLNLASFTVLNQSHAITWERIGRVVTFTFKDIHLLDSTTNEAESHGYITYSIAPKTGLAENTIVQNTAYIYFDYNPAVITNTTQSTYVTKIPKASEETSIPYNSGKEEIVFPNPANDFITISNATGKSIRIINSVGIEMYYNNKYNGTKLELSQMPTGIYFVEIKEGTQSKTVSFCKK